MFLLEWSLPWGSSNPEFSSKALGGPVKNGRPGPTPRVSYPTGLRGALGLVFLTSSQGMLMPQDWKPLFQPITFILRRRLGPREGTLESVTHPGPQ